MSSGIDFACNNLPKALKSLQINQNEFIPTSHFKTGNEF